MAHVSPDDIRGLFSRALSDMYQAEVPQYADLLRLVAEVNRLSAGKVESPGRLEVERHGAIRVGTAEELFTLRRLFGVMGMRPVGYYDLAPAGVPVHSTAFRPVTEEALAHNPLRIFTSLLRLELIADEALRTEAAALLAARHIFTPACLGLILRAEEAGGLMAADATRFVAEALETFRWHSEARVGAEVYQKLRAVHPLVADVVCFKGPHINHLTPRTLDIETAQALMPTWGMAPKAVIEGPPSRRVPILLRQTSFKALREPIAFPEGGGTLSHGAHTARFGEIEQRGAALTPKGRALYDQLLTEVQTRIQVAGDGSNAADYAEALNDVFRAFPDDEPTLRREGLAWFRYRSTGKPGAPPSNLEAAIDQGFVRAEPITYEDFLPVSAAGIFRSNLSDTASDGFVTGGGQPALEDALGAAIIDEMALYRDEELRSKNYIVTGP